MANEPNQDLPTDPPKPNQDLPGGKPKPGQPPPSEGEYVPASGDISPGAHPGGTAPTEDPRNDAGLEEQPPTVEHHD